MFNINTDKIVAALKPYGPTPVVAAVMGVAGLAALSVGASPLSTVVIVVLVLGTHIYGLERRAALRKKELEVEFDVSLRSDGGKLTRRLENRLERLRKPK